MSEFKEISLYEIKDNLAKLISKDWMLVTAGTLDNFNMMTANWGTLGYLWQKEIAICFVRPVRHTYQFTEMHDFFTLTFFEEKYRDILRVMGTKSGRDMNKMTDSGLTPTAGKTGLVYFEEARIVMECRKIYFQDIKPENFLLPEIDKEYPQKDYHRMYIGEVVNCLVRA